MNSIYLVGFMGSGKSTIGHKLSKELNLEFIDLDAQIEENTMKKIVDIFAEEGENQFRQYERQALSETKTDNCLIATGGGIVELPENRAWLSDKQVIYLKASWETIVDRLKNDSDRPIWQDESRDKKDLFVKRDQKYNEIASHVIKTDGLSADQVVEQLKAMLA